MTDLGGHIALVTGGARRIGRAITKRLAASGAGVVVHYNRSSLEAKALVEELEHGGHAAWAIQADLEGPKVGDLVKAAAKLAQAPITLLVNNASRFPASRIGDLQWSDLTSALRTDAWAPLELTRAMAAQLPRTETGSVVNLLDARIVDDDRGHAGYWLAKRMLADLTRLCAVEFAPRMRVNGVAPGPVLAPDDEPEFQTWMGKLLPLGRTPTPEEVAEAVASLLSASATTGQILYVDGGRHLGRQPSPSKPLQGSDR